MYAGTLALLGPIGLPELVIILFILVLVFGAKRLSGLGRGMGQAIRGFKDEMDDGRRRRGRARAKGQGRGGLGAPGPGRRGRGARDGEFPACPPGTASARGANACRFAALRPSCSTTRRARSTPVVLGTASAAVLLAAGVACDSRSASLPSIEQPPTPSTIGPVSPRAALRRSPARPARDGRGGLAPSSPAAPCRGC